MYQTLILCILFMGIAMETGHTTPPLPASTDASPTGPLAPGTRWVTHPSVLKTSQFKNQEGAVCGTDFEMCLGAVKEGERVVMAKCFLPRNTVSCPNDSEVPAKCVRVGDDTGATALREVARAGGPTFTTPTTTSTECALTVPVCTAGGGNDALPTGCRCSGVGFPGSETTCVRTRYQCTLNKRDFERRRSVAINKCRFKSDRTMVDVANCHEFCGNPLNHREAPCKNKGVLETTMFATLGCTPLERATRGALYERMGPDFQLPGELNPPLQLSCTPHACPENKKWVQGQNSGSGGCVAANCAGSTSHWNPRTGQCQATAPGLLCEWRCMNIPVAEVGTGWSFDPNTCNCSCNRLARSRIVLGEGGVKNCQNITALSPYNGGCENYQSRDPATSSCVPRCPGKLFVGGAGDGDTAENICADCPTGTTLNASLNQCRPNPAPTTP